MTTRAIRELLAERRRDRKRVEALAESFDREDVAAAALMVECARIDGEFAEEEHEAICRAVREELDLSRETAECLVAVAERREDEVWHDFLFTKTIKMNFDEDEKLAVIRRLWEVALADGKVHPFEERLISRVARELGISREAQRESRERAREKLESGV
jgi:uncharacterized tellurite resistance protein B-like protein